MAKVELKQPTIIKIEYHQEREDDDYGTCLWANFLMDMERYDLHITSDCGNYSYGWVPTPNTESFLKLLSRIDSEYLLNKISTMCMVNTEETFNNVLELLEDYNYSNKPLEKLGININSIHDACTYSNFCDVINAIRIEIEYTYIYDNISDEDLYDAISLDYPTQAK